MKTTWTSFVIAAAALACGDSTSPLVPGPVTGDAQVVETYELQKIGDGNLPQIFSGGQTWWQINGGHYDLMADGTYDWYYIYSTPGITHHIGYYTRTAAGTIEFYLSGPVSSFYLERNRHFATGTLGGSTMTVHYDDPVDFEEEIYTRRK